MFKVIHASMQTIHCCACSCTNEQELFYHNQKINFEIFLGRRTLINCNNILNKPAHFRLSPFYYQYKWYSCTLSRISVFMHDWRGRFLKRIVIIILYSKVKLYLNSKRSPCSVKRANTCGDVNLHHFIDNKRLSAAFTRAGKGLSN